MLIEYSCRKVLIGEGWGLEHGENEEALGNEAGYPELRVKEKNPYFAQLLMVPYAGRTSEMTAVCTYSYQAVLFGDRERTAAVRETLTRIAKEEMTHFTVLGRLIVLLGGDPRIGVCSRGSYLYWAGSCTNTEKDFGKALRQDIADEEHTVTEYAALREKICDPNVSGILERMRREEEEHVFFLQRLAEVPGI